MSLIRERALWLWWLGMGVLTVMPVQAQERGVAEPEPVAAVYWGSAAISWQPYLLDYPLVMTLRGPQGFLKTVRYAPGTMPMIAPYDENGQPLPNGVYRYTLRVLYQLDVETQRELAAAQTNEDRGSIKILEQLGRLPTQARIQNGSFTVKDGLFQALEE